MTSGLLTFIIVAVFAVETLIAVSLRHYRKASLIIVFIVASILLVYKSQEFIRDKIVQNGIYPVEFSHICYFIMGVTVVTGCKKMRAFASYCGMLAGLAFMIASIVSSQSMINDAASPFSLGISVTQHMLLWFCGFMLFLNVGHFDIRDIWIPVLGIALMVVFSYLVHLRIIYPDFYKYDDMVIIKIAEGTILGYVIAGELPMWLRVGTVAVIAAAVAASLVAVYKLNDKYYRFKAEKCERQGVKYDETEIGIFPLIAYIAKAAGWERKKPKKQQKRAECYNCCVMENSKDAASEKACG